MRVNHGLTRRISRLMVSMTSRYRPQPQLRHVVSGRARPEREGYERGVLTTLGAIAVDTGIFTGRSPKDKYLVRDDTTRDTVWWSDKGKGKTTTSRFRRKPGSI